MTKAVAALILAGVSAVLCGRAFEQGTPVKLWANKVGPFSNPSETYQYYDLPFCRPEGGLEHKPETLGEVRLRPCIANAVLLSFALASSAELKQCCTKSATRLRVL